MNICLVRIQDTNQGKFDYSPLGKIFNRGLKEEDKKEGLLTSVENIGDKNKDLLQAFSTANKVGKAAKNESDLNYDSKYAFYRLYRDSEKFKRMVSIDSKHGELKNFWKLLSDFKNHKPVTIETKKCKNRIINNQQLETDGSETFFRFYTFRFQKAYLQNSHIFAGLPNIHITSFHTKNNFKRNNMYKKPSYTNNSYEKTIA